LHDPESPDRRTAVLGVLGGVASGKSLVARLLAGPGGRVLDADQIAREVLESPEGVARLRESFGEGVLDAEGRPDREALARRVFGRPAERARLEDWIHPEVRARIWAGLERARREGVGRVVLDVPLLLEKDRESGFAAACDILIFVDSDPIDRGRRAEAQRRWEPGEVERREADQLSLEEKRAQADCVIQNRGTPQELDRAVQSLLEKLGLD